MVQYISAYDTKYRELLPTVAKEIVDTILKKDQEYGASWKRRGGIGAYMMLVRKSDRLEAQVASKEYDIFRLLESSHPDVAEQAEDTLKDQVAYGLLILAEFRARRDKHD